MPSLSQVRAANAAFSPGYLPVAVFVGGTSGIGEAMAKAFAQYTKGNSRIIIIGRNKTAAESIIESFPKPTVKSDNGPLHEFVHCDANLLKNVHATAKDLLTKLHSVNFLVLSPAYSDLSIVGRDETEEGIDKRMALYYYARWTFIHDLMPLLQKAKGLSFIVISSSFSDHRRC
jgi:NAD(P)-dependent dehydrogenase (short-subunit alcohol dehydrogenase family)